MAVDPWEEYKEEDEEEVVIETQDTQEVQSFDPWAADTEEVQETAPVEEVEIIMPESKPEGAFDPWAALPGETVMDEEPTGVSVTPVAEPLPEPVTEDISLEPTEPIIESYDEFGQVSASLPDTGFKTDPITGQEVATVGGVVDTEAFQEKGFLGQVGDAFRNQGLALMQTTISFPQAFIGIVDMPIGGRLGILLEQAGIEFDESKRILETLKSQGFQESKEEMKEAKGFIEKAKAVKDNPELAADAVTQSLSYMLGGHIMAKGVLKLAPKLSTYIAGALGEGGMTMGAMEEQLLAENKMQPLTARQTGSVAMAGLGNAALSMAGGRFAKKMGARDFDDFLLKKAPGATRANVFARVPVGIATEALEELPQELQETFWSNVAMGKPWNEGMDESAVMALASGGLTGGGVNLYGPGRSGAKPKNDITNWTDKQLDQFLRDNGVEVEDKGVTSESLIEDRVDSYNSVWKEEDVAEAKQYVMTANEKKLQEALREQAAFEKARKEQPVTLPPKQQEAYEEQRVQQQKQVDEAKAAAGQEAVRKVEEIEVGPKSAEVSAGLIDLAIDPTIINNAQDSANMYIEADNAVKEAERKLKEAGIPRTSAKGKPSGRQNQLKILKRQRDAAKKKKVQATQAMLKKEPEVGPVVKKEIDTQVKTITEEDVARVDKEIAEDPQKKVQDEITQKEMLIEMLKEKAEANPEKAGVYLSMAADYQTKLDALRPAPKKSARQIQQEKLIAQREAAVPGKPGEVITTAKDLPVSPGRQPGETYVAPEVTEPVDVGLQEDVTEAPSAYGEIVEGYTEGMDVGVATLKTPEDVLLEKEGIDLEGTQVEGLTATAPIPPSGRDIPKVDTVPKGRAIPKGTTTTDILLPDSFISPADDRVSPKRPQPLGDKLGDKDSKKIIPNVVTHILDGNDHKALVELERIPKASRKGVLRKAIELAEKEAKVSGDYDLDKVIQTGETAYGEVKGTPKKLDDVAWAIDKEFPGMYEGHDPKSGKKLLLTVQDTKKGAQHINVTMDGKMIVTGAKSLKSAYSQAQTKVDALHKASLKKTGDYSVNRVPFGKGTGISRLEQYQVMDSKGKLVKTAAGKKGFETGKEAKGYIKSIEEGTEAAFEHVPTKQMPATEAAKAEAATVISEQGRKAKETKALNIQRRKDAQARVTPEVWEKMKDKYDGLIHDKDEVLNALEGLNKEAFKIKGDPKNAQELLDAVVENNKDTKMGAVADYIKAIAPEGYLSTQKVEKGTGNTAVYMVKDQVLKSSKKGWNTIHALHEILHSVTTNQIEVMKDTENGVKTLKALEDIRMSLENELLATGKVTKEEILAYKAKSQQGKKAFRKSHSDITSELYAIGSRDELITMGFTNSEVQRVLKQIQLPQNQQTNKLKTLWDKFLNMIHGALGLPTEYHSAMESLVTVTADIASTPLGEVDMNMDSLFELHGEDPQRSALEVYLKGPKKQLTPEEQLLEKARAAEAVADKLQVPAAKKRANALTKIAEAANDAAIGINDRIEMIWPAGALKMRETEATTNKANANSAKTLRPFQEGFAKAMKKFSNENGKASAQQMKTIFSQALANSNADVRDAILKRFDLVEEHKAVQKEFDSLSKDYVAIGLLKPQDIQENYWHREVKQGELDNLLAAMANDKDFKLLDQEVKSYMNRQGLKPEDAPATYDKILTQTLKTGKYPSSMRIAKGAKERTVPKLKMEWMQYYKDPFEAAANHFEESHEVIGLRKMIGQTGKNGVLQQMKTIEKEMDDPKNTRQHNLDLGEQHARLVQQLDDISVNLDSSISTMINEKVDKGELTTAQRDELTKLFRARLTQKGVSWAWLKKSRDISLAAVLGSPLNTMTQFKDQSLSLYNNGAPAVAKAFVKVALGKHNIKRSEFDLTRQLSEFREGGEGGMFSLSKIFKSIAFTQVDGWMKTATMQAALEKAKSDLKSSKGESKFRKKYEPAWGKERVDQLMDDLKVGKKTDDTDLYAITELSKFAPMWLSELPVLYNQGGNARAFYTLMSYSVRALSATYRESLHKVVTGKGMERAAGLKNLVAIGILYGLVGAGVEEIKDSMGGRQKEGDFFDNFKDEIWGLFLMNKYMTKDFGKKDWFHNLISGQILLPVVDVAGETIYSAQKVTGKLKKGEAVGMGDVPAAKYIPVAGKLIYNWSTAGKSAKYSLQDDRKELFGEMKELIEKGGSWAEWRKKKNAYNEKARKVEGMKEITQATVHKKRQDLKRKAREAKLEARKGARDKATGSVLDSVWDFIVKDAGAKESFRMDSEWRKNYTKHLTMKKVNELRKEIHEKHGVEMKVHEIRTALRKEAVDKQVDKIRTDLKDGAKEKSVKFLEGLAVQENAPVLKSKGLIHPNVPPEKSKAGERDIAFGHKITPSQEKTGKIYGIDFTKGITKEQAKEILKKDYEVHKIKARAKVGKKFDDLPETAQNILIGYAFTGVLNQFTKFTKAILDGDYDTALKEHKRSYHDKAGVKREMKRRNEFTRGMLDDLKKSGYLS